MQSVLASAIASKTVVEFNYSGHLREVEPHVLGELNGKVQLLGYQIGGSSSSGEIPEWRRFDVSTMTGVRETNKKFAGARPVPSGKHSSWDHKIAIVAP